MPRIRQHGRRLAWALTSVFAGGLVVFHVWLLWARIARSDFGVSDLIRWGVALLLLGAVRELWRRGRAYNGRKLVVLGLLVVALHMGVSQPGVESGSLDLVPWHAANALFLIPASMAPLLAALIVFTALFLGVPPAGPSLRGLRLATTRPYRRPRESFARSLFARPPPF